MSSLPDHERITPLEADLENRPWPLPGRRFGGIVVTNYLWRPLFPAILEALDEDGVLIYETFAVGNERFGRPSRPDFLLRNHELLDLATGAGLEVLAFEQGQVSFPKPAAIQRLCARNVLAKIPA